MGTIGNVGASLAPASLGTPQAVNPVANAAPVSDNQPQPFTMCKGHTHQLLKLALDDFLLLLLLALLDKPSHHHACAAYIPPASVPAPTTQVTA